MSNETANATAADDTTTAVASLKDTFDEAFEGDDTQDSEPDTPTQQGTGSTATEVTTAEEFDTPRSIDEKESHNDDPSTTEQTNLRSDDEDKKHNNDPKAPTMGQTMATALPNTEEKSHDKGSTTLEDLQKKLDTTRNQIRQVSALIFTVKDNPSLLAKMKAKHKQLLQWEEAQSWELLEAQLPEGVPNAPPSLADNETPIEKEGTAEFKKNQEEILVMANELFEQASALQGKMTAYHTKVNMLCEISAKYGIPAPQGLFMKPRQQLQEVFQNPDLIGLEEFRKRMDAMKGLNYRTDICDFNKQLFDWVKKQLTPKIQELKDEDLQLYSEQATTRKLWLMADQASYYFPQGLTYEESKSHRKISVSRHELTTEHAYSTLYNAARKMAAEIVKKYFDGTACNTSVGGHALPKASHVTPCVATSSVPHEPMSHINPDWIDPKACRPAWVKHCLTRSEHAPAPSWSEVAQTRTSYIAEARTTPPAITNSVVPTSTRPRITNFCSFGNQCNRDQCPHYHPPGTKDSSITKKELEEARNVLCYAHRNLRACKGFSMSTCPYKHGDENAFPARTNRPPRSNRGGKGGTKKRKMN